MKLKTLSIFILGAINILGQQGIPDGVVYKQKNQQINTKAYEGFKDAILKKKYSTISNELTYIGPNLWERYKKISSLNSIEGGNITFKVPFFDSNGKRTKLVEKTGKLIQSLKDFNKIAHQLHLDIVSKNLKFRKLNYSELEYYWSIIFFDIIDPVFIVDTGNHKILVQMDEKGERVFWIDEIN